ncbi:MAG: YdeI/OmpD-associated family protein [Sinomicrobium sp.]|nr:YdeI/OmpD-associated family protein [Sinomicrobium sp.]
MKPVFFATQLHFREWLEKNHDTAQELLVGYYKVKSGKPSMTWPESVDQALCFGWIDGIRRSVDEECYCIRFTPRRPTSIWSAVNIKKVEVLIEKDLMHPAGMASFEKRKAHKSEIYSYENKPKQLSPEFKKTFMAHKKAWDFFSSQAPSYQKTIMYWIMSARQEKTRLGRLEKTIRLSDEGKRVF